VCIEWEWQVLQAVRSPSRSIGGIRAGSGLVAKTARNATPTATMERQSMARAPDRERFSV
jgi:hypothetical protein